MPVRALAWTVGVALPLAPAALLAARARLEARWENHAAHFWLVLARGSFWSRLAFVASAGFLGLTRSPRRASSSARTPASSGRRPSACSWPGR